MYMIQLSSQIDLYPNIQGHLAAQLLTQCLTTCSGLELVQKGDLYLLTATIEWITMPDSGIGLPVTFWVYFEDPPAQELLRRHQAQNINVSLVRKWVAHPNQAHATMI